MEQNCEKNIIQAKDNEQIIISGDNIIIENVIYSGSLSAFELHPDGRPRHTFRTQTVLVDGDNITFKDCEFYNNAGTGSVVGQAIALYVDGDNISFENCRMIAYQDTLFLAPLPPKEYEKDGFLGPKQYEPRTKRVVRFKNCIIEGSVDFVFGGATAYFDNCKFISNEPGYVFAPCTPEDVEEGFVVRNCRFEAKQGVEMGSCYIGRPWREYAKVRLIDCYLGDHINKKGWDDWGKTQSHQTIRFEEYGSYGPGASNQDRPYYVILDNNA